ncbi:asparaginase [Angustibacter sp. McL0619]|uniref:asparaginase n=1 Tax=Angustibacter sp. McL0619 TaxID=3415676 RepID=UPI003CF45FB9
MAGSSGGVVARLSGRELLANELAQDDGLQVRDLRAVPSADLSFSQLLDVVDLADEAVRAGAQGIVMTQGTDTLEETAFLVDSVWPHDAPFVVTGAMRNPTLPGADGTANVLSAVQVARSSSARDRGALVVLDDEIHAAAHVRKAHSTSTGAFVSPDTGPLGRVVEGTVQFLGRTRRRQPLTGFTRKALQETRIALYTATFADDPAVLEAVAGTCQGLVVAGFGVGHVPSALAPRLGELAATIPVVLASRTGAGPVLADTYGAVGSERDLRERGLIGGGFLHPFKARVLLRLLVASGATRAEIEAGFADLGG